MKRIIRGVTLAILALVAGSFMSDRMNAQEARGTITGKVTDSAAAVIQGASVKITNVAMGTNVVLSTNDAGSYTAPYLIPGTYLVTFESAGFKKYVREGIRLQVNDTLEINAQLEVGEVQETITVTADSVVLDTATASMGQVVDSRRVAELPMPHGEPYNLIGLAGGVSYTRDPRLDRPFEPTHIVGYSMDGTRANRSDITIDGGPSTSRAGNNEVISSYVPPADLVQEFKVQTATFDASFGNTEGGVTNLSIKSGTNLLHGTGYWTKMAPDLFANDFFANRNGIARPNFRYDRWGGTVGGPVYIPKLFDGRNKTFFVFGHEGIDESRPRNNCNPCTVPTEKMRSGDFSELLALGPQYQIYNPFTRRAVAGGRFQQDPFPNNVIPANLINPIARKFVDGFLPKPLSVGAADFRNNYLDSSLPEVITYYTNTIKIDHVVSDRQRLFVRGSWYTRDSNYNNYYHNQATGTWFQFFSRQGVIDDVYTFDATTVLNVSYGYNRYIRADSGNPASKGMDLTSLGFPASYNTLIDPSVRHFPRFDIAGYTGTATPGQWMPTDIHSARATLNKARGAHFVKGGLEFRSYRENRFSRANDQTGTFTFNSTWTRGPLDNSATAPNELGQSFASFLLGLPSSGSVFSGSSYAEQSLAWGLFVHDDWKVSPKLTLNLGLRWEFESPLTERFDRSVSGFDRSGVQPMEGQARTNYGLNPTPEVPATQFNVRGGLLFPTAETPALYETPKKNFMPRFGFAYKLTEKTVVRGGYGIFYGFLGQRRFPVIQSGFTASTPLNVSLNNGLNFLETLSTPFQGGLVTPLGASEGIRTFLGQNVTYFNQTPSTSYMQRWQLGFQRELPGDFVFEGSYVGNRGTDIEITRNLNVTPRWYLSTSPVRDNTRDSYLAANVPNPFVGLMPNSAGTAFRATSIARERLLRPYPHFDQVNDTSYDGYSWYHSLQLRLEKRFSKGYTIGANYTLSKFMQASELLNQDDPRPTEVISDLDRPHRLTVSGIYELPFGRGRPLLANSNGIVSRIVGGWQMAGVYTFQAGAPINFGNIIFNGDIRSVGLSGDQQSIDSWFDFNNAGWVKPTAQQLTRNVRTFPLRFGYLRADNINNYDLSVLKKTEITETKYLEFRAEFINAFNHALFAAPTTDPVSSDFGRIRTANQANYPRRVQLMLKFVF